MAIEVVDEKDERFVDVEVALDEARVEVEIEGIAFRGRRNGKECIGVEHGREGEDRFRGGAWDPYPESGHSVRSALSVSSLSLFVTSRVSASRTMAKPTGTGSSTVSLDR